MMNKDEFEGKAEALKGKFKQAAGDLTDDDRFATRAPPTRWPATRRMPSAVDAGRSAKPSRT